MLTKAEASGMMRAVTDFVRGHVAETLSAVTARLAVVEARQPERGLDGRSVTVADVAPLVSEAVEKAVSAIPVPKDGTSISLADVEPIIAEAVAREVAMLPAPAPGKDADPAVITDQVDRAIAALPPPTPGKDADPALIIAQVEAAVAALPPPQPGRDADPELVRSLVAEHVKTAVEALPNPLNGDPGKDGTSVAIEDVLPVVLDEFSKSVVPDEVAVSVAKAVRLMAETSPIVREPTPAQQIAPAVHVHMPTAIHIPEIKSAAVKVTVEQPPRRKTATTVTEHDAKGRIKRFEQEEIDDA